MKQAIVARRDLGMGPGKLAAQVAHAAVRAAAAAPDDARRRWRTDGETKVVLAVEAEAALFELVDRADAADLPSALVRDAGRTELEPGTPTAVAIGPAKTEDVDAITGDLPLF